MQYNETQPSIKLNYKKHLISMPPNTFLHFTYDLGNYIMRLTICIIYICK